MQRTQLKYGVPVRRYVQRYSCLHSVLHSARAYTLVSRVEQLEFYLLS